MRVEIKQTKTESNKTKKKIPVVKLIKISFISIVIICIFTLGLISGQKLQAKSEVANEIAKEATEDIEAQQTPKEETKDPEPAETESISAHPHVISEDDKFGCLVESYYIKTPESVQEAFEESGWSIEVKNNLNKDVEIIEGKDNAYIIQVNNSAVAPETMLKGIGKFLALNDKSIRWKTFSSVSISESEAYVSTFNPAIEDIKELEDFYAESFYRYINNPSKLSINCPKLFDYWENRFGQEK